MANANILKIGNELALLSGSFSFM